MTWRLPLARLWRICFVAFMSVRVKYVTSQSSFQELVRQSSRTDAGYSVKELVIGIGNKDLQQRVRIACTEMELVRASCS